MEKNQRTDNQRDCRHKQSNYKHELGRTRSTNRTNRARFVFPSSSLELLRNLWIAEIVFVEINNVQPQTVLHLTLAQIVQVRLPVPVLGQILRHVPGQKNMPGIAAIQHPLRDIYSRSCKVRFVVNIGDLIDRANMNSHPHLNTRTILQGFANFECTSHWFLRATEEKERHPIASGQPDEFTARLGRPETFGIPHDPIQLL